MKKSTVLVKLDLPELENQKDARNTPLDFEEIEKMGETLLDIETQDLLARNKSPMPKVFFFLKDGSIAVMFIDGSMMQSGSSKNELANVMREMIREHDAIGTAFFSDTYMSSSTTDTKDDLRRRLRIDLPTAYKLGIIDNLRDVLMIKIESSFGQKILLQYYKHKDGKVALEERTRMTPAKVDGRFDNLFPQATGVAQ